MGELDSVYGKQIVGLLEEKLGLLNDIRDLTLQSGFGVVGTEMDVGAAERYAELYEQREPLMECISNIDKELAEFADLSVSGTTHNRVRALEDSIRDVAQVIYTADEEGQKVALAYLETIKSNIRNLKKGRAASVAYGTEVFSDGGTVMDKKQ